MGIIVYVGLEFCMIFFLSFLGPYFASLLSPLLSLSLTLSLPLPPPSLSSLSPPSPLSLLPLSPSSLCHPFKFQLLSLFYVFPIDMHTYSATNVLNLKQPKVQMHRLTTSSKVKHMTGRGGLEW